MNGHANKKASTQLNTSKTISKNYFSTWTSYTNVLSPFCQDHLCWNKRFWLAKHSGLLLSLMKGSGKFPACYRSRSVPLPNFNVTWLVGPLVAGKRQRIFLKRRVFGVWSILVKEKCTRIVIMKTQIQSVRVISLVLALGIRTMSGLVTSLKVEQRKLLQAAAFHQNKSLLICSVWGENAEIVGIAELRCRFFFETDNELFLVLPQK